MLNILSTKYNCFERQQSCTKDQRILHIRPGGPSDFASKVMAIRLAQFTFVDVFHVSDNSTTPHNVGSVLWRLFSTLEVVQYIGGITSVLWGDSFSTVGG